MRKDRVFLLGDANVGEFARQIGEVGDLDAGDVVEVSGVIGVTADAVSHRPDLAGNVLDRLMKALPLSGNGGAAALPIIAFADAGDEKRLAGYKRRCREIVDNS